MGGIGDKFLSTHWSLVEGVKEQGGREQALLDSQNGRHELLKEGVNEWGKRCLADDDQSDQEEENDQDRREPPLLVLTEKGPEFAEEAGLGTF